MQRERDTAPEGEEEEEEEEEKKGKKRGRKREEFQQGNCPAGSVYQFFTIEKHNAQGYDYCCVLCDATPKLGRDPVVTACIGPNNLVDHMKRVHQFQSINSQPTSEQKKAFFGGSGAISKERTTKALVRMIIRDLRPFSVSEAAGFTTFLTDLNLSVEGRTKIATRIEEMFKACRESLRGFLRSFLKDFLFSISVDGWSTSVRKTPMYCMTIHFLTDEFELVCLPLAVQSIDVSKTAEAVKEWIRKVFKTYSLNLERLLCLTSDEASVEECATKLLKCYRVPCAPHRLSNVVKTAFEEVGFSSRSKDEVLPRVPLVQATKKMVKFINNRGKVVEAFEGFQEKHNLRRKNQLYCDTRFIGSVLMGKIFLENRLAIEDLISHCAIHNDEKPWKECPEIREEVWLRWQDVGFCTKTISDAVERLSGGHYPTVNQLLPAIVETRDSIRLSKLRLENPATRDEERQCFASVDGPALLNSLNDRLAHYFEKDLSNPVILLGCLLDPRYRDWGQKAKENLEREPLESDAAFSRRKAMQDYFRDINYTISQTIRESAHALFMRIFPKIATNDSMRDLTWMNSPLQDEIKYYTSCRLLRDYSVPWQGPTQEQQSPPVVNAKTNVLEFWKNCHDQNLWRLRLLARAILAVPASAVSCERIWSSAGRAFTKARGALSAEMGGKQIFLHEIMKAAEAIPVVKAHLKVADLLI
jgi:hypothetical protein